MVFLVPNFYFIILDTSYYFKTDNELCTGPEIIDTLEECKVASNKLGHPFDGTESSDESPKGCYGNEGDMYWNAHTSGGENSDSYAICKKGEKMERITSNALT